MNAGKFFLLWFFILLAASGETAGSPEEGSPRRPNPLKQQTDLAKEIDYLSQKLENLKAQKAPPEAIRTVAQKMVDAGDRLSALTDGERGIDLRKQVELYKLTGDKKKFAAARALLNDEIELDSLNKKFRQEKGGGEMLKELKEEMDEMKKMKPSREKQLVLQKFKDKFATALAWLSDPKLGNIALVRDLKNPESVVNLAELEEVKTLTNFLNKSEQETAEALSAKRGAAAVEPAGEKILPGKKAGWAKRLLSRKGLMIGLGVGAAAVMLAAELYVHQQLSNINDKIAGGEEPFSQLRPILWGASAAETNAGFTKYHSTYPNTIDMKVTVTPSKKGMRAMAIPLNGMPENFICDIDVNEKGFGNSTWVHGLKPVLGCIVFRGEEPLEAGKTTTVIVHFPIYWEYVERYGFFELADPINRVMEKLLKMPLSKKTVRLAGIPRSHKPADPE